MMDAERTLAILSPDYLASLFTQPEWAAAFAMDPTGQDGRLIPVRVRECASQGLLAQIVYIDLIGLAEQRAREALRAGVRKGRAKPPVRPSFPGRTRGAHSRPSFPGGTSPDKPPLPLYRSMAPPREPFVHRSQYDRVVESLLAGPKGERAGTVGITTALRGTGGFGKTALAIEVCWDERIQLAYPDGILWATMGETIESSRRLTQILEILRWWTGEEPPSFETATAAGARLRETLAGRRVLLVVDDVWKSEDVEPFRGLGLGSALLVTTRDSRTLPPERTAIEVDAMASPEAVALLGAGLPDGDKARLGALAARLGEWPLLLKLVNRQLWELLEEDRLPLEQALRDVEEALEAEGVTAFDQEDAERRRQAVARTLDVSFKRLTEVDCERYGMLAIFPEDEDIPLPDLERLWGLGSYEVRKLCGRLHNLSLLLRFDRSASTVRLHDVVRSYLLKDQEAELPAFHGRLLDAYRPISGCWTDLPKTEIYLWRYLVHHLMGCGQSRICRDLLLDFDYLQAKLAASGAVKLLGDYSWFREQKDEELRLLEGAIRLSAHVLAKSPDQLASQLCGRLLDREEPGIQRLLRKAREGSRRAWLRPKQASFIRPGGALIRTLEGHRDLVTAVSVVDKHRALSGSSDGTLRLWDLTSGETLRTLEGHRGGVWTVSVVDGRRALSGSLDGTLQLWDLESGEILRILEGHEGSVTTVSVIDGRRAVSSSLDGTLRLWDLDGGEALRTLKGHEGSFSTVSVVDSHRAVSGSRDGVLQLWNLASGETLRTWQGHDSEINVVSVIDSRRAVSGSRDGVLRLWDLESGETLRSWKGHRGSVMAVSVMDGRRAVSCSSDGTLRLWDLASGEALCTLKGHSSSINAVSVVDDRHALSGSGDKTLRLWNLASSESLLALEGHSARVNGLSALDGRRAVSCSDDGTLRLWDLASGETLRTLEGHGGEVTGVSALDGRRAVSCSQDKTLRLWDLSSGETLRILKGHRASVKMVSAVDGHRAVSSAYDGTLRLWDLESGETLRTLDWPQGREVTALAVVDRLRALSGSSDTSLRVWDLESGECLRILQGRNISAVYAVSVVDSGRALSGTYDGNLWLWDLASGETLGILQGHTANISALSVVDGCHAVSASYDGNLRLWELEIGKSLAVLTLDASPIALAFSPESGTLVVGDEAGRVHFFAIETGTSPMPEGVLETSPRGTDGIS